MRRRHEKREEQTKRERAEKPVYTAIYKAARSDELLEFLLRKCKTSRNNVKNLLVRRQVLVNGNVTTQYDYPIAKDDEIKLSKTPLREEKTARATAKAKATAKAQSQSQTQKQPRKNSPQTIGILYEDDDFLAVDKPCGLLSVESDKERESAYLFAAEYLREQAKNARPYVLHRIDKETSGVLVFAKDIKIHSMLKMRWNELVQTREYYAVVEGTPEQKEGKIETYLKENANHLVYATNDPSGQRAVTRYRVLSSNAECSLLLVEIDTGRKNQIRVHMQKIRHPIVGDDKYGHTKNPLKRLGLHASKLSFLHPKTKELITITSPLPPSFRTFGE